MLFGVLLTAQPRLTESQKLQSLCKVWGFLKYYHPQVAKGKFDWDAQLLQKIPAVKSASDKEELSQLYLDWIASLGKVSNCKSCVKPSTKNYFDRNFNLSCIDDGRLTAALADKLRFIEQNRFQGKSYYVGPNRKKVGNVALKNEPEYLDFDWADAKMRLFIVFKYWNVVDYFFPYKYQMDQPWDITLIKTIEEMQEVASLKDFQQVFNKLVVGLNDAHAGFYPPAVYRWTPHILKYIAGQMVVAGHRSDSSAQCSPLKIGDVIKQVDGTAIATIIKEKLAKDVSTGISGIGIFYPDGTETQRKGVKIDIEVKPTIKGIQEGRDEVLDQAIAFLKQ